MQNDNNFEKSSYKNNFVGKILGSLFTVKITQIIIVLPFVKIFAIF